MNPIPFNQASHSGKEKEYALEVIQSGRLSGDGPFTKKCQQLLEKKLGVTKALLTTSCTDALEMSALLLDLQPGDEVIVPAFTFVSTVNAFFLRGAVPKFVDVRADTLNLDEKQLERATSPRTKAIVVVHYAGVSCEMDEILKTAARHKIPVIEDNAHGLFGKYKGKNLGTFGSFATQSFHETKNFSCGEGGALLINDSQYIERAEIIREKGTNRSRFFRGLVDKYSWVDLGSSFLPSDLLSAILLAQLEKADSIQTARRRIWESYATHLKEWALSQGFQLPVVPPYCEQTFHMFYLLAPNLKVRHALIDHLKQNEISAVFHYLPLHLSEMGQKLGGKKGECPITEDISDRLIRLPFFNEMSSTTQEKVIQTVVEFKS